MLFTTKTEYGVRAMVALAKNGTKAPMSLAQIAVQEHISQSYLERLISQLKADDLVKSMKGASGGYILTRAPKEISIFEIVESLEGPLAMFYCLSQTQKKMTCSQKNCLTKKVWTEVQIQVIHTLRKFTLADLI